MLLHKHGSEQVGVAVEASELHLENTKFEFWQITQVFCGLLSLSI
jgi:hypothetical protein